MLVLVGKSCSGKSSIVKELEKLGYEKIVTYTTRPMRIGEVDGEDYHFIGYNKFELMLDDFAESTCYHTTFGDWYYGSKTKDYTENDKRKVIILTPNGLNNIKKCFPDIKITSIYIDTNKKYMKLRSIARGDNWKEFVRRYRQDKKDFKDVKGNVDFIILNTGHYTLEEIAIICKNCDDISRGVWNGKEIM